ncbi:MAG: hypothetical protein AAGE84_19085 [Cyanobacteria bacterium P01_G01_bin.39]
MNFKRNFDDFSVKQWQEIKVVSQRIEALNSLLNFFEGNKNPISAQNCQEIADVLIVDFDNSVSTLLELIEAEDSIE